MTAHVRRALLVIVWGLTALCLLLGVLDRSAQAQTPAQPLACEDGDQPGGARYRICLPTVFWNGDLVVYAHGYVSPNAPVSLPEDQLTMPMSRICRQCLEPSLSLNKCRQPSRKL